MRKSQIQASLYTALSVALILIILIFGVMKAVQENQDDTVMVSLGDNIDGFGQQVEEATASTAANPEPQQTASQEKLITQDEESIALEKERKRKEDEKHRQELQQKEEIRRKAAEKATLEAKQKQQAEAAHNMATGAFGKAFGEGSGTTTGDSHQGNPVGHGSQGGHSWSLNGRNIIGRLSEPTYHGNQEGTVVVDIRVDKDGNVTNATIGKGTTITNETLRNESIKAAMKNKFTTGSDAAYGKITYHFILR